MCSNFVEYVRTPTQGCLKYFWKVKVPNRYCARNETSGPTFAKIGALLLNFAILLLFCHFGWNFAAIKQFHQEYCWYFYMLLILFLIIYLYFADILQIFLLFCRKSEYFVDPAGNLNLFPILPAPIWNSILHFRFPWWPTNTHGKCQQIQSNTYCRPAHPRALKRLREPFKKTG